MLTPKQKQEQLVEHGMADDLDQAAHILYDMGEIDSSEHEELLSEKEAERIYG
jgi:hypothetical protein